MHDFDDTMVVNSIVMTICMSPFSKPLLNFKSMQKDSTCTNTHFCKCCVVTLLSEEWENDSHTPEMGTWESTGTPKTSNFNFKGQNTLHWGVRYIIGKLSKCSYRKWACMSHLDICSTSCDKKKGRESN
jgi:hypothetical protein